MFRADILLVASFSVLISFSSALYDEMYRPQLHYSHPTGWLSDPNGLVYKDGIFHLFHQCRDNHTAHGPMQWGHAISKDLIHWKTLPTALYPPAGYAFYSGGGILDHNNSSGLQTDINIPPLVVFICVSNKTTLEQNVWMAYSNQDPQYIQFQVYEKQPLMPNRNITRYFRDPMPIKYNDHYVLIVGVRDRHVFYKSRNLIDWEYASEFGENDGAHGGSWECANLFPYTVTIDGRKVEKYVLTMTRTTFQQPIHQYFIGSFDGEKFVNENSPDTILWLDYGPDSFAGGIWYDMPDGRRFWINWMGRWEYAIVLKENAWNGQMGLVRELKLIQVGNKLRLTSFPIREVKQLRTSHTGTKNVNIWSVYSFDIAHGRNKKHLVDIEMTLDLTKFTNDNTFDIVFSGQSDELKISFKDNEFTLDRSAAGNGSIPNSYYAQKPGIRTFGQLWTASRVLTNPIMKLRIIIDANCIEMFIDEGLSAMSALFYSKEDIASKMTIEVHGNNSKSSYVHLKELDVYEMKSIWAGGESSKTTTAK